MWSLCHEVKLGIARPESIWATDFEMDGEIHWNGWEMWFNSLPQGLDVTQASKRMGKNPLELEGAENWRNSRQQGFLTKPATDLVINMLAIVPILARGLLPDEYKREPRAMYGLYKCQECDKVYVFLTSVFNYRLLGGPSLIRSQRA